MFSVDVSSKSLPGVIKNKKKDGKLIKVENLRNWSFYEYIVYNLDVLVPEEEPEDIFVPTGSYLQKVSFRDKQKWRVLNDGRKDLPNYLNEDHVIQDHYEVIQEKKRLFPIFDPSSKFIRQFDILTIFLLLFTAIVTPYETAFLPSTVEIDVLFLINQAVNLVFVFDMFVQCRSPYRDVKTGKLVTNPNKIFLRYATGWGPIDLLSVIPFELLAMFGSVSSQLQILRVLRLMKLAKLLRLFRASRKLKQLQIYITLRYSQIQVLKTVLGAVFLMHWFACGFRLVAERASDAEEKGWVDFLAEYKGLDDLKSLSSIDVYVNALYMAAGCVSLIGFAAPHLQPHADRELIYMVFVTFISYFIAVNSIATLSNTLSQASETRVGQDILIDNYLELFDKLKLDTSLKLKVNEHLTNYFAQQAQSRENNLLKNLPVALHGFISMEIFMNFVMQIPYLIPFIEREPVMTQTICRGIEIRSFAANSLLFANGLEGIYYLQHGILAIEGKVYISGAIFGLTVLREDVKKCEARCLTNCDVHVLPREYFMQVMSEYPKVKYYIKRWTAWQLLRDYIFKYKELYYTAAKRGSLMDPPLVSARPNLDDEDFDDIDVAVLEYIREAGF